MQSDLNPAYELKYGLNVITNLPLNMSYCRWKPDCCLCESNFGEMKYLRNVQHFLQHSQALSTRTEVFISTKLFLCILVFSFYSMSALCGVVSSGRKSFLF